MIETKTTEQIMKHEYPYGEEVKWVRVSDVRAYLDMKIQKYISYCIKNHKVIEEDEEQLQCSCADIQIELLRLFNELSKSGNVVKK
jgi:hypothetical protein